MIWYVKRGEYEVGPLGADALRALVGTGQVTSDTLLWHEGLPDWTAATALGDVLGPRAAVAAGSRRHENVAGPTQPPAAPRGGTRTLHRALAGILLATVAAFVALQLHGQHNQARYGTTRASVPVLQQELMQAANGVNASTPRMIDKITRLDGASAGPGASFTYDYTLTNIRASQLSPSSLQTLRRRLLSDVRETVCRGAVLQPLLRTGAVIRFRYRDQVGQELVLASVSSADCARF
jgi:hypothetical protein